MTRNALQTESLVALKRAGWFSLKVISLNDS